MVYRVNDFNCSNSDQIENNYALFVYNIVNQNTPYKFKRLTHPQDFFECWNL